ncbi:hypothetical protein HYW54_04575 [Candidatus Gottesmanbacteria bacterium]|nr:hypothetical protein [Candidatus Gottesmanbacteria bacterium]
MKKAVFSKKGAKVVGPYSPAIKFGNLLFISGQIGIDAKTGALAPTLEKQTNLTFKNIEAILKEENLTFDDVLKANVYLQNMDDFVKMNEIYAKHFNEPFPARATVQVARLPKDALIEIEVLAGLKSHDNHDCDCGGNCGEC